MVSTSLTLSGITFGYGDTSVIETMDLTMAPGELCGVVGPNGSGKTTLLGLLSGHLAPATGTARIYDSDIAPMSPKEQARLCALAPQEPDFSFPFTVAETVLMGRHPHIPRFARPSKHDLDTVESALESMDLGHIRHRPVSELSGGERQRTVVARSLAQDTPILLLDEPTASMDIRHALSAMNRLRSLAQQGTTVVAVLHDLSLAIRFCHRIVMLKRGRVHAQGPAAKTMTPSNIKNVFGVEADILSTDAGPHIIYR